jgi:lactate dehydrogenase-like 2-hydroxyacid dehydrogenase
MALRVLYLSQPALMQPWYDDFCRALGPECPVELYDPQHSFEEQVRDTGVVVDQGGSVGTPSMIAAAAAAGVRLWQVLGTGLDHVDRERILASGMRLANTPGLFSAVALAEHALFLMLCFAKRLRESERNVRSGRFHGPVSYRQG